MRTRTIGATLGALALLGADGAAAAATTIPYGGYTAEQNAVTIQVTKDGRQIKLARTALDITCSDGSADFTPDAWEKVPVSKRGAFKTGFADQPGRTVDDKPMLSSGSFDGRINSRTRKISGTWSYSQKITQADGSVVTCSSGTVRFTAAGFTGRKPLAGGYYGAFSSADFAMVFKLSARGLDSTRGAFELKCSKGGYRFVNDGWVRMPISRRGKFGQTINNDEQKFSDGSPYKVSSTIAGTVSRSGRKLSGTWTVRWEIPEADGVTDVCTSGPVRFSVKR